MYNSSATPVLAGEDCLKSVTVKRIRQPARHTAILLRPSLTNVILWRRPLHYIYELYEAPLINYLLYQNQKNIYMKKEKERKKERVLSSF
jgi:hypothetical protein